MKKQFVAVMFGVLAASSVYAQQVPGATEDPFATARFRLGVVGVDPRFGLQNFGVDTNVFNTTSDEQRDFTFTVVPGSQFYLRTGKGLLSVNAELELVQFAKFSSERSVNSSVIGQYQLRFNRLRPYVSVRSLNTRERPGYEIDARARHFETDVHAGTDLNVASKSAVRIDVQQLRYSFDGDALFGGRPLNQELNRTLNAIDVGWRQRLTALTTWVTRVTRESERFEFVDLRNSDSLRVRSGFELGRFALIRGSAFLGYRRLTPADGGVLPAFSGVTADVDVSYTSPTQTRLGAAVERDVQYSYESTTPYYVQTGWTATLTQRVVGRWDVQLTGGRDRLSYQAVDAAIARRDFVGRFGGGVGYTLGERVRVGFDVRSFYRRSDTPGHEYGGIRAGMSVTYGY